MTVNQLSNGTVIHTSANKNVYKGKPITDIITNGFFTVDHKWIVKSWNNSASVLLGVPEQDIIGKNLWEKFAGVLPLNFYIVYHKAFLSDIPVHFVEYWAEMNAWFDVITYNEKDLLSVSFKSSKMPAHPAHPAHPVAQLKILNELYRYVTEVTNDCLWEWNFITKELFWIDGGHKRVFGYAIENSLIPQSFWESRVHPRDLPRILRRLENSISSFDTNWEVEYQFKKLDGEYLFVHDRGHIIYDDQNKAVRMIGATQDITSRKLSERKLLESERKLSLIARQMTNAVVITDADENITWVNEAFTKISGYDEEEVIGKKPGNLLYGIDSDAATLQYIAKKISERQPYNCDLKYYGKNGRCYWMHLQGQPMLDDHGIFERYFTIETDITEKVALENKLMQERQDRQREITDAVLTAHENERSDIGKELHDNLNQILGATKLYIELAKTDAEKREMCLEKASDYVLTVIEEIRRISKTLAPPGMVLGLFDSIKSIMDDLLIIHPMNLEFKHSSIDEEDLNDKLQLTIFRIVQEQLNNIIKHSCASRATIELTRVGNEIILIINDNGVGCDISKVKKGVGIINIRSRAELYGGKVRIVSMTNNGYELKVILPLFGGH